MTDEQLEKALELKKALDTLDHQIETMDQIATAEVRLCQLFNRHDVSWLAFEVESFVQKRLTEENNRLKSEFDKL